MSQSRTVPVIIVNASPGYTLALLPLGAAFLVLAFLFRRTLPYLGALGADDGRRSPDRGRLPAMTGEGTA